MVIYIDATGLMQKAKNDTLAHAAATGIALGAAGIGQWATYAKAGARVTIGATVVPGACFSVSSNAGGVQPEADMATGYYITQIGRAPNTTDVVLEMNQYGYVHA